MLIVTYLCANMNTFSTIINFQGYYNYKMNYEELIKYAMRYDPNLSKPREREFIAQSKNGNDLLIKDKFYMPGNNIEFELRNDFTLVDKNNNCRTTDEYYQIALTMNSIEEFFGFKFENAKRDLFEIASHPNSHIYHQGILLNADNNGNPIETINLHNKYQKWKNYCVFVDNIKNYIEIEFGSDWYSKNQTKANNKIYDLSKLFPNSIFEDISSYLHKYNLNQHKEAKIDVFKELSLPGTDNMKITKKIVELYLDSLKP